jgi:hypothetical protein
MSKKLFHYTPVYSAVMILRDGVIRRSSGKTPPYVWLSSNTTNEPTAARLRALDGTEPPTTYGPALLAGARFVFQECEAIPWQDLPLTRAVRSELVGLAEPKGGRPEEWFALDADVPSASLPLEIKDEIGAWREIAHEDLKRQHEDFVRVTKAVDGRLIIHHAPPTLSLPQP